MYNYTITVTTHEGQELITCKADSKEHFMKLFFAVNKAVREDEQKRDEQKDAEILFHLLNPDEQLPL